MDAGLKLIQRHRKINEALKTEIAQIHALQICKCQTPDQAAA
jgi:stress-induced morphogen